MMHCRGFSDSQEMKRAWEAIDKKYDLNKINDYIYQKDQEKIKKIFNKIISFQCSVKISKDLDPTQMLFQTMKACSISGYLLSRQHHGDPSLYNSVILNFKNPNQEELYYAIDYFDHAVKHSIDLFDSKKEKLELTNEIVKFAQKNIDDYIFYVEEHNENSKLNLIKINNRKYKFDLSCNHYWALIANHNSFELRGKKRKFKEIEHAISNESRKIA